MVKKTKRLRWIAIAGGGFALLLVAFFAGFVPGLPDPGKLKTHYPHVRSQGPGKPPRVELLPSRPHSWVSLRSVSQKAVWAVVVSEDWAFYQHEGLDWGQIQEAAETNWRRGRLARGASTISQQVVKNVFLTREKTLSRKLAEVALTLWMEQVVPKGRILETYLNVAEWGEGIYGIGPAARRYFGKAPSELTAREGAYLATLLPSPIRYSRSFRAGEALSDRATNAIENVLDRLAQAGLLTEEERREASFERFPFENGRVSVENEE